MVDILPRLAVLLLLLSTSLPLSGCRVPSPAEGKIHQGELADGIYKGSYRHGLNKAVAKVTIQKGAISKVELLEHSASWIGNRASEVIPLKIVEKQSINVDAVTGATRSSNVIMNAVYKAVCKAKKTQPK